jgi:tetrahydromethanopterin S-methyltransferase subunit G
MAFLGDFGRALGLGTSQEFGGNVGQTVGSLFGPVGARIGENIGRDIGKDIGEIGQDRPEPSPATPAGIDSPASASQVSQTSRVPLNILDRSSGGGFMPQQAFIGGLAPAVTGIGRTLFGTPSAAFATGGVAAAAVDFFVDAFGQQKKLVITRKMQRDVKKLFMMSGGNFNMTAELYRMATGRQITGEQVVKIITKTFKNQGPYVTKAAVRKTRSTIRKMETLCDLKDRLCPPKRRAPARRRTMSTSITQVK